MKRKYVILEESQPREIVVESYDGPGTLGRPSRDRGGALSDFRVDVEPLDERDVGLLRRDRHRYVAAAMPMKLIKPVRRGTAGTASADPYVVESPSGAVTWGVAAVGAHSSDFTGLGSSVAVLDTGIDAQHPAFAGVDITERDFTGTGNGDRDGHGTHCAGTIFGRAVDGIRIAVAPGVRKAYIGKVLGDDGAGSSDMIFRGLQWAINEGVDVISMSLGFDFPGQVESEVNYYGVDVREATSNALVAFAENLRMFERILATARANQYRDEGAVIVAAAGNENSPQYAIFTSIPAASDGVLSVGAVAKNADQADQYDIATFSNCNPNVAAPGVGVLSAAAGGGLVDMDGTSMACPHVAGVAALWWEQVRRAGVRETAAQTLGRLLASVDPARFPSAIDINRRGSGLVCAP